ncbi:MAG: feruloyl-CoA synthase [Alphaproteobacteria bacterium]|nr:feruloyl-CoA synthase [Alphaproteobacteria bacterium]
MRFAPLSLAPPDARYTPHPAGGGVLTTAQPLAPHADHLLILLERWAAEAPDRVFLAERPAPGQPGWRTVTFAEAHRQALRLAGGLRALGATAERPLMILSGNSLTQGLLILGAMAVGIPAAPISPAYSLLSRDHAKLKDVAAQLTPGAIYVEDGAPFARALAALGLDVPVIARQNPPPGAHTPEALRQAEPLLADLGPDTIAKILFTSGSTGRPKGVINTQRMLCANQQAIAQLWPFLGERPPVLVDWLPWSHTFGGNHNFNMMLHNGGTLYIDAGKPAPGAFAETVRNLGEVPSTLHFNVPRGYGLLLDALEQDADLRRVFFQDLDVIFYAGAALPQNLWARLEALAIQARGQRIHMLSAWGSTETAPMATAVHFPIERAGVIGLPAPGTEIRMIPVDDRLELRVRGPNVTPGYWRSPALTARAFDGEGFFKMGDAARFADPEDPSKGIVFAGRTAENFKLQSGTWVLVSALRLDLIAACAPWIQDCVIAGHDRNAVGILIFPSTDAIADPAAARAGLRATLEAFNRENPMNSRRVARALLLEEPPDIDAGEITDKGYLNQRAILQRRAAQVARLYSDDGAVLALA